MREPRSGNPRLDLHVHTFASGDNDADPAEVIEAALERGLDGVAFTEHHSYGASEHAERLRERWGGAIAILRGVELAAAEGHCLVFGADTDPLRLGGAPVADVVRAVSAAGGVVIPSHPFRRGDGLGDLIRRLAGICALEGCNGVTMHTANVRAIEAAQELGIPWTGGSDAHAAREVGSCYTQFEGPVTPENFVTRLREGRFRGVDTRKVSRLAAFSW